MGVRFGASIKGLNENPETGNPKNIVGMSWAYTYQRPGVPNIYIYIYYILGVSCLGSQALNPIPFPIEFPLRIQLDL